MYQNIPDKETLEQIAELFKGFADPTRVRILALLALRTSHWFYFQNEI